MTTHQVNMGWLQNEAARIAQQQAQREQAMGTKDFYSLETGYVTYFRIAPPWSAAGAFGLPIGRHYGVPGSAGNKGNICLANWPALGMQCPLCAVYEKLYEDSPKKSPPKEEAYQSKRREYFYVNAFIVGRSPRVNQGTEDVPQWVDGAFEAMQEDPLRCRIVKLSPKSFNYFVNQYWQTKIDITNVHEGVLCMITVTGTGKATRYVENMAGSQGIEGFQPQRSKLFEAEEHITHALSTINDLNGIWKQPDDVAVQEINQLAFTVQSRWGQQVGVPTVAGAATLPGAIQQPPAFTAPALPAPGMSPSPVLPPAPGTPALPAPPAQLPVGAAPAVPMGVAPPAPSAVPAGAPAMVTAPPLPPGAAAPALPMPGAPAPALPGAPALATAPGAPPPAAPVVPTAAPPPAVPSAPAAAAPGPAPAAAAPAAPPTVGGPPAPTPPGAVAPTAPPPPAPPAAGVAPPAPGAPAPALVVVPAPAPAPAAPVGTAIPAGAPECYGQHHVISNHPDPTVQVKCQGCAWSNVCEVSPANMALKTAG